MLDALAQAMPDPQSGVSLEVLASGSRLLSSTTAQAFVEDQRRPRPSAASAGVVNGELIEIDFAARRIGLRLLGVKRDIACSYEESARAHASGASSRADPGVWLGFGDAGVPRTIEAVDFIRPIQEAERQLNRHVRRRKQNSSRAPPALGQHSV